MGCEREQKQPSEHWQTLGWSRKSTGTQKQHTPPESAYRLGLDSNSAAWVFRQLWRKNCCRLSAAKRRFCLSSADASEEGRQKLRSCRANPAAGGVRNRHLWRKHCRAARAEGCRRCPAP